MLYCPKCQKTYEDATQRFCLNDGRRLMRAVSSEKISTPTISVFANILNRKVETETDKFVSAPKFSKAKFRRSADSNFLPPFEAEIFEVNPQPEQKSEIIESAFEAVPLPDAVNEPNAEIENQPEIEPEVEPPIEAEIEPEVEPPIKVEVEPAIEPEIETKVEPEIEEKIEPEVEPENETQTAPIEQTPRLIAPWEIPQSDALVGDGKTNPAGREVLTWKNPSVLIDQVIKGRYLITEQIGDDESGIRYLAEDKLVTNKKVVVRVLMDEDAGDSFAKKVFAEERVSLSHINHPNIVGVIDSGELSQGKPFVVNEFVEGKSVEELLQNKEKFDVERVARIIRQAANALSEVHQIGVLHRNLQPANIVLTTNEQGAEQVKLTNFGASKDKVNKTNLPYKSPEQIEGKLANVTSDEYSLAIIAYQMLTGQMPFKARSVGKLLKARREGLKVKTTKLRTDLPAPANAILAKALAFNAADRYPKTRDFGDALYNAVFGETALNINESKEIEETVESPIQMPSTLLIADVEGQFTEEKSIEIASPEEKSADEENIKEEFGEKTFAEKTATQTTEKYAENIITAENVSKPKAGRALTAVLGAAILILGIWGIWSFFLNRPNEAKQPTETANVANQLTNLPSNAANNSQIAANIETAPLPRSIIQPPNTNYFQNAKANLKDESLKNYLGFSLYYPKDWKLNLASGGNADKRGTFFDISKDAASGTPIEQMIVSYYGSKGTFQTDAENFKKEVTETNETLSKIIPNYEMVSEGEKTINNGWQTYEVKFKGTGTTPAGEKITLWGKRLFVPAAVRGVRNGYMITMLATSLSKDITSVEDVGIKGDLPKILAAFEPNQTF